MNNDEICNINFKIADFLEPDMKYLKSTANDIAYTVYNNPCLISIFKDFLLSFINNEIYFEKNFKEWKKNTKPFKDLHGDTIVEQFTTQLYKSYKKIKPKHIDKFRGLVFERLMEMYYKKNHCGNDTKFSHGCKVFINNKEIVYIFDNDKDKNRSTIDIALHNRINSNFYELKVGPSGFDNHVINYLNILNNEASNNNISDTITVGCMTLKEKESLKMSLKLKGLDCKNLELNGICEIKKLFENLQTSS